MGNEKKVVIIAGPNGAGKTTFAREFLPAEAGLPVLVNADLIAAGISPFDPGAAAIRAGRLMLSEIDAGRSFAVETTLAGHAYLNRIGCGARMASWSSSFSSRWVLPRKRSPVWRCACSKAVMTSLRKSFADDLPPVCETSSSSTAEELISGSGMTIAVHVRGCWRRERIDE